jgi:hypothetical protein
VFCYQDPIFQIQYKLVKLNDTTAQSRSSRVDAAKLQCRPRYCTASFPRGKLNSFPRGKLNMDDREAPLLGALAAPLVSSKKQRSVVKLESFKKREVQTVLAVPCVAILLGIGLFVMTQLLHFRFISEPLDAAPHVAIADTFFINPRVEVSSVAKCLKGTFHLDPFSVTVSSLDTAVEAFAVVLQVCTCPILIPSFHFHG